MKKLTYLLILLTTLFPCVAYASGMEGLGGFIVLIFLYIFSAIPGNIIKHLLPLPARGENFLSGAVFIVMLAEIIFMAISPVIDSPVVSSKTLPNQLIHFLFAFLFYLICALFPNVLLLRRKNQTFVETILKPKNIAYGILLALPTPICFGLIIICLYLTTG